ncbi:endopeptidase La [Immundisolibacter sp.]|uniref:endopeptidase La n=3 Tax=Immundisolibacter sp. TaxID=1934948 RepID=UPI003565E160
MNSANPEIAFPEAGTVTDDLLIILPVRNLVLFPGVVMPLTVGRKGSVEAAQEAARGDRPLGLLLQKDGSIDEPGPDDLYRVGTVASVLRFISAQDGAHHLVCQGEERFRVLDFVPGHPYLMARVERLPAPEEAGVDDEARVLNLRQQALQALELLPQTPAELVHAIQATQAGSALADLIISYMDLKPEEKQEILELLDLPQRLTRVSELLARRIEVLRISRDISEQTREKLDSRQREFVLREQLKTIQKELGEADDQAAEVQEIAEAIAKAGMPKEVEQQARKELKRLERMPEASGEYPMLRTYLDWLTELPWSAASTDSLDIPAARQVLDEDHWGLEKVKRRILEHLAVRKLSPEGKSPILCFVGPPGVGKTSLGQSIARAMGREFLRVSLGGVHDEAEIRGHRRTYVGALPGTIIQAIRRGGTRNPVLMLDEMDKLGQGFHGDPSSALLEVLDPEQNHTFRDNYLAVPFDLSQVMFIATANVLDSIPGPLRDRMEVIELPGYTQEDKLEIARRYLIDRQRKASGLTAEQVDLTDAALSTLIDGYTREAGCRNLEREIGAVFRHVAVRVAEGETAAQRIDASDVPGILGSRKFDSELAMRTAMPGVATGLAWTPVGGDILFIEASRVPGNGKLILTGQLGDVMKESVQAALSLLKARAGVLGLDPDSFEKHDIHVHVPAGAIPKDGPSAGVAMFVALHSLHADRCVRADTAMTGEISLRGLVLPVGGIKEKIVAAHRAGICRVMLPARNKKDYDDIPVSAREQLEFVWLENVDQALDAVFDCPAPADALAADGG